MRTAPDQNDLSRLALESVNTVCGDRNNDYGHPLDDFTRTAGMWSALFGHSFTAKDVALAMVCVKLSREVHHPKRDNLVDGIGYLLTAFEVDAETARRTPLSSDPT